jgi:hypothetical protein
MFKPRELILTPTRTMMTTKELQTYRNELNADLNSVEALLASNAKAERRLAVRGFLLTAMLTAVERELQISKIVDFCLTGK